MIKPAYARSGAALIQQMLGKRMQYDDLSRFMDKTAPGKRDAVIFRSVDGVQHHTYEALDQWIDAVAVDLAARAEKGARIGVLAENSPAHFVACMGAIRAGRIAVPINYKLKADGVAHICDDAGVQLVIRDKRNAPLVPEKYTQISIETIEDLLGSDQAPRTPYYPAKDDVALLMYTSGSTGAPKGVPITHYGYRWALDRFSFFRESIEGTAVLIAAPLFHMNAQFHIMSVLAVGGTAVLFDQFRAQDYLQALTDFSVTRLTGVPTMFELILRALESGFETDTSKVQSIAMGSAPVTDALFARLQYWFPNALITNGYGTTEIGPATFGPHPEGLPAPTGAVGYPMSGVSMKLIGGDSVGEGVLHVRSPMTAHAYLNRPEATAEKFKDGWCDTGDIMRRDADGFYYFIGRADDMFVCGGENIYPGEVEQLISRHKDIREAAVVPIEDPVKGAVPVAFVVPRTPLSADVIKQYCIDNGPVYAHPRFVQFKKELPLSGVKKVDRQKLIVEAR
ncbi:MAG: class I adenylate-forming enzyme family protein, partial [Pseudomonadota bacterium]